MIKELLFHIGDPKCGSTAIQEALRDKRCQCDTASISTQKELNASALANSLIPGKNDKNYAKEFGVKKAWAAETDADIGIISAEFFAGVQPEALLRALQEFLPDYAETARFVAYVRPHHGRVISGYAQQLRAGAYFQSLRKFVKLQTRNATLHYTPRFSQWRDVFGARFILRPFIREEMLGQDVVRDFFHHVLQGAPFGLAHSKSTNESLSLEELTALSRLQSQLDRLEVPEFLRLSIGGAVGREMATQSRRFGTKIQLDKANAKYIRDACHEDAAALDAKFFHRPLMEPALTTAVENAVPKPQSLEIRDYYPYDTIQEIDRIAEGIAALIKERPLAWRRDYQRRIGQRFDDVQDQKDSQAKQENAEQVWALLRRLIAHMTPDPERGPGHITQTTEITGYNS